MTKDQYEKAKIELEEKRWKLKHLSEGYSYSQHLKMQIEFLEHLVMKYEEIILQGRL